MSKSTKITAALVGAVALFALAAGAAALASNGTGRAKPRPQLAVANVPSTTMPTVPPLPAPATVAAPSPATPAAANPAPQRTSNPSTRTVTRSYETHTVTSEVVPATTSTTTEVHGFGACTTRTETWSVPNQNASSFTNDPDPHKRTAISGTNTDHPDYPVVLDTTGAALDNNQGKLNGFVRVADGHRPAIFPNGLDVTVYLTHNGTTKTFHLTDPSVKQLNPGQSATVSQTVALDGNGQYDVQGLVSGQNTSTACS